MSEADGADEFLEGQIRTLVTAAGQVGERLARERERRAREAQRQDEQRARELTSRFEAERRAARAELTNVERTEWWAGAEPRDIAVCYQLAQTWQHEEPQAARAGERIRHELQTRYGVDVTAERADPATVERLLSEARESRDQAETQTREAGQDNADAAVIGALAHGADQRAEESRADARADDDVSQRAEAEREAARAAVAADESETAYDSAERRESVAAAMRSEGVDDETAANRMRADLDQARPAPQAVQHGQQGRAAKARVRAGRAMQVEHTRGSR